MFHALARLAIVASLCLAASARASEPTPSATLSAMPPALETRLALSALPPALRDRAGVFRLDPASGYQRVRTGDSGIDCLVERTQWELAAYRDDLFVPVCYDAAGARSYLQAMLDTASLRAHGVAADTVKATIAGRYRDGTYVLPARTGLSYMLAPVMRTIGPPDLAMHTMAMPHLMVYAPGVTNADIGAQPDLADPATLRQPFIDRQGNDEQSYIIVMTGEAEKARILAEERDLVDALCAWRPVLCLPHAGH